MKRKQNAKSKKKSKRKQKKEIYTCYELEKEDKLEKNNLDSDEENALELQLEKMREDQNIYINKSVSTDSSNSEESPGEEEKMNDIDSDFFDSSIINDSISSKGKPLKKILYMNL